MLQSLLDGFVCQNCNMSLAQQSICVDGDVKFYGTSMVLFSARCNVCISRLCYDASVRLSVCL